jgi:hypothetical protein
MNIRATGRVVDGHLRVDIPVDLPDNTEVELIEAPAAGEEELDPELEAALDEGEAALTRGERGTPAEEFLDELLKRSSDEALPGHLTRPG